MTRRSVAIIAVVVVFALVGGTFWQRRLNTDARQIRKALHDLVERAQLASKEDALKAGLRSRAIGNAFTEDVAFTTPVFRNEVSDRPSLVALVFRARSNLDAIAFSVHDVEVEVADEGLNATMILSFHAEVSGMGAADELWRDAELAWRKDDGAWRIAAAETIQTIQRPGGR